MNKKIESEGQEDPYEVIRRLKAALDQQKQQIQGYEIACNSLSFEKEAAVKQANDLKSQVEYLNQRLEYQQSQQLVKSSVMSSNHSLTLQKSISKQNRHLSTLSPQILKNDFLSLNSPVSSKVTTNEIKTKQFVPRQIVFKKKESKINTALSMISGGESSSEHILENVGDNLIQDFVVICPDVLELKRLREQKKDEKEFNLFQYYFFNHNTLYKNRKAELLKDVARRAFPLGAKVIKKNIDSFDKFKMQMENPISEKMGQQFFIFNFKGDFADNQKNKTFLGNSNPFQALFVICLKVPDFIPIRQQKSSSFNKKEQEVWMVNKVYAVLTYLPFFNIHLSLLAKIHNALQPGWYNLQKEEILARNLQRNLTEIQQNPQIKKMINYFLNRKPDYNMACLHQNHYFGCLPQPGFNCQYSIASFTCPIFFSIFAYEQMLLLITAMFMQKTIIFVSKSQSASSLCSLFLTTILAPFKYNQHLIINCDKQKIDNIVFEFPFILIASIKKDQNFGNILRMFIDSNCDRFKGFSGKDQTGPMILVDIDSNSIFYDSLLNRKFEELIVSPSQKLRQAYLEVNSAHSKSFSFPKKMPVQVMSRPKNDYQKNWQQRRKLQKQYQQKIDSNTTKWPTYQLNKSHLNVLKLLTQYIQSYGISSDYQYELIKTTGGNGEFRKEAARRHLHDKHPFQQKLVDVLVESQLFADYLDELQKKIIEKH